MTIHQKTRKKEQEEPQEDHKKSQEITENPQCYAEIDKKSQKVLEKSKIFMVEFEGEEGKKNFPILLNCIRYLKVGFGQKNNNFCYFLMKTFPLFLFSFFLKKKRLIGELNIPNH